MATADRDQDLQLDPTPSGVVISLGGRRLNSRDAASSFLRRFPDPLPEQALVVVFSPLLGEGLPQLLERLPPTTVLLLVEFEQALFTLGKHRLSKFTHRGCLQFPRVSTPEEALREAQRLVEGRGLRRIVGVHATGGSRLHAGAYARLEEALREVVQRFWSNRGTQIRLGRRWVTNLLANACLDQTPLHDLTRSVPSSRAVLLGAGCDLENRLEVVRTLHDRGVPLVALDTALPALAEAGIEPALIVAMDGQLANALDLLPWRWNRVKLIADLTVHPAIPRRFPPAQRSFFASRFAEGSFFSSDSTSQVLEGIPLAHPRGSVAPAAMELLVRTLGVRTLLAVGIDFHYRLPRTHARLTAGDRLMRKNMTRLLRRDGNHEYVLRPRKEVLLRTGERIRGDAILADQALQMRHATAELQREVPGLAVLCLNDQGLDTGARLVSAREALEQLAPDRSRPAANQAVQNQPKRTLQPPERLDRALQIRRAALEELLLRLRRQEEHLDFLDSGLAFVLLDLPQWPLLTTRRDWAELHRGGILRSTRDYRRRLERILSAPSLRSPS
ncbi:6-hydroxymethylpterin diphosphokinase MptE-like protein [Alkalispirochaeta alkalica]|uniref:6-hydroxymethylpterin diphosphokinase MptE-like protein n=1 Tax=Alkalispirochaeta alkalica TaxID=46356 RepID=UPI00037862B4|nr:6-hydroxymethylpterin diphosphokinase MptE-like protein [Alkalispirochaeta alkalica]